MSAVETLKAYRTIHNADNVDDAIAEIQRCYERIDELGGEIERLRDELDDAKADYLRRHKDACDYYEVVIRLRAENAELRGFVDTISMCCCGEQIRDEARAILAKEGE